MKPQYLTLPILIISSLFAEISVIYTSDFEAPEGFADGASLSGDWTTTDNTVVITDETAQSGTQSVRIPPADPENILSLHFTPSADTILFADYYMQLTASVLPEMPSFTKPETTALIAVQPSDSGSGEWVFLNGDGSGGGVWFTAGDTVPLDEAGRTGWHRFTLRFNLTLNVWDVYIDGNLLAINLGFFEALTDGSEAINIYGSRQGVAYLDNFSLSAYNPLFDDTDLDGIDDAFETAHGLDDSVNDRNLDPDLDGLSNIQEYLYGTHPKTFDADDGILSKVLFNRTNWYVDSVNGDDVSAVGSAAAPFRSLSAVLSLNDLNPDYVGAGDTVYLTAGEYAPTQTNIDIAGLRIEGTLGNDDVPVTQVGNIKVTADNVTLKNLDFHNAGLTLQNTKGVNATNNLFSGSADTSLSLIGASENVISHNYFASAIHQCVYIYWDKSTEKASNDNLFLSNYFTHRPSEETSQIIYCNWTSANEDSICARNRFVDCAFEETTRGLLKKVIYDGSTWWMVVDHQYSVRFEDCYFKRADRDAPFSEFVIVAGDPDFEWRWDELVNDTWVSSNDEYAITGDYKGWSHAPRVQFVNANENGLAVETSHSAGLLSNSNSNSAPEITSAAITSVDVDSVYHYTVTVSDMDSGDIVTVSAAQLPEWLSFAGTTLSGTPTATEIGTHTVEIIATDSYEATDTQTFILTVNAAGDDNAVIDFDYVSILFDQDYAYSHTGSVSGTVRGLGSGYADYSIRVYSKTDADYLIGTVDIDSDGAWSIGSTGVGQKIARLYSKVDTDTALAEVYGEGETAAGSYVNQNDAPGLDFIASPIELEESAGEQTLLLTGIHDGDHGTQTITISAISDNPGLIADPVVAYDPANSPETATLSYTPQNGVTGAATITLTLQDDGGTEVVGGIVGWKRLAGKDAKTIRFQVVVGSSEDNTGTATITDRTDWYVDPVNGNDVAGIGSETKPFGSLAAVLSLNANYPDFVSAGDTIHLAAGNYDPEPIEIAIAELSIEGTLDVAGKPLSKIGNLTITAADVTLKNLDFHNTQLTLQGVTGAEITNNMFSGSVSTSLSLIGASNNVISHNHFASAIHQCVYIYWDSIAGQASNDNLFLSNYFTHHPSEATNQIIYCNWTSANEDSICARNRFVNCAFEETVSAQLSKVIFDEGAWWMVVDHEYSLRFEDCFFKRADRLTAFSQFNIIEVADEADSEWQWDELLNDEWVAPDYEHAITGDYKNWGHSPRVQFVNVDENGTVLEQEHTAGLLNPEVDNYSPVVENPIASTTVGKDAEPRSIDLYDVFEDVETADTDLAFSITNTNSDLISVNIDNGNLVLEYSNVSGKATITVVATDNDPETPKSVSISFEATIKIDLDGDGLNDEFEQAIIDSDPNDGITSLEDVLPRVDFDGDGYSNELESINNTNPADPLDNVGDQQMPNYSLIDLGENVSVQHISNKGHVLIGSRGQQIRWYWGETISFNSDAYDSNNNFQPFYNFDDMNNHGEMAGIYYSKDTEIKYKDLRCGRDVIQSYLYYYYQRPVIIQQDGSVSIKTPPQIPDQKSFDNAIYWYMLLNDNGDYIIASEPMIDIVYAFDVSPGSLGTFLHEYKNNAYTELTSGFKYKLSDFSWNCSAYLVSQGVSPDISPGFYNNNGLIAGAGYKTYDQFNYFGTLENKVNYRPVALNQNNQVIGSYLYKSAYLFDGNSRYSIPSIFVGFRTSLSSPEADEALMLLESYHLAIQKRNLQTGDLVPLSQGADAYTITSAEQILHKPNANGNPTQNAEWSSPTFSLISDNGNFIAGNATKNGVSHAVLWVKVDMEIHDENGRPQKSIGNNRINIPVNGDFDEEKQVNGRYVRDYEDTGIGFANDATDLKTDDLRSCVFDVPGLTDELWQNTTLTIRKKSGVIDPETGEEEAGEIRIHAIDANKNWVEVPLSTNLAPDFYAPTGQYVNYDSWWIEGIKDGPITIEMEVVVNDGVPITIEKKAMVCTEKTKAEWQQEVWNDIELVFGIDASTFNPNNSFISNNDQLEAIYNYYGETFFRDEENYLWPGLGKLAGASVYAGLVDAEIGVGIVDFFTGYTGALNFITEPTLNEMQGILMLGADRIFSDLAWQFKAYHTSGLCALKHVFDKDGELLVDIDVWVNINEGVNGANTFLSEIGNQKIAFREQNVVIQSTFEQLERQGWEPLFTFFATNPVPEKPMFKKSVPGGKLTNKVDRWNWVLNDIWYHYTGAPIHTQRDWVSTSIYELSKPHARTY